MADDFQKMNARQLAGFVQENWTLITGWTSHGMDEENPWHEDILELLELHGVDILEFQEEWNMLREAAYDDHEQNHLSNVCTCDKLTASWTWQDRAALCGHVKDCPRFEENFMSLEDISSRQDKMKRREKDLVCSYCPPNGGENSKRHAKHGAGKPRGKKGREK